MNGFLAGLALGFGSGIAPGPLFALVVTTSLHRGLRAGVQVAIAPLLTDLPVILLSISVLSIVPPNALAVLGLTGAAVLVWFAVESFQAARSAHLPTDDAETEPAPLAALRRGALVNLVNPSPWLFWVTIGGPILVAGWRASPPEAVAWLLGFYLTLVGSKVALAGAVAAGRHRLSTRSYRRLLALAGGLLLLMAGLLAREALQGLLAG